jgi:Tetracyclin repressor-like, C-terminal domain
VHKLDARGELEATDPAGTGRAVFDATARFHNPAHAPEWFNPGIDAAYERVRALVLNGLTPRRSRRARRGTPRPLLSSEVGGRLTATLIVFRRRTRK